MKPSSLAEGNLALRNKQFEKALHHYRKAEQAQPELAHLIQANIKLAKRRLDEERAQQPGEKAIGIDIVVPVFNALEDVKVCLASLQNHTDGFQVRVIVVNDGSDQATTQWLREFCEGKQLFSLIEHPTNSGYTRAVNSGLKASTAPYVITQNSDTIVSDGWLTGLIRCMRSAPNIGIVGPLSNAASWQNVPALRDASGGYAVNELPAGLDVDGMARIVARASVRAYPRLPFINGFCFMISRAVIEAVGYMDELNFPVGYGEENDFCIRAQDAGFELVVADDVFVFHAKSKSFGHERRITLSEQGARSLKNKHTVEKYQARVETVKKTEALDKVRARIQSALEQARSHDGVDLISKPDQGLAVHKVQDLPSQASTASLNTSAKKADISEKVNRKQVAPDELLLRIREYKNLSRSRNKRVVVYTAISNNYDVLKIPEVLCPDWDYVCFSDRKTFVGEHPWQIRNFDYIDEDSTRTARYIKTHPHVYFKQHEYSIWIDAHILIKTDFLEKFTNEFVRNNSTFAAIPHPFRTCSFAEAEICAQLEKDDKEIIHNQSAIYREEGLPTNWGLIESQILIRKHNEKAVRIVNESWWSEVEKHSRRDQLSLMFVLWKNKLRWTPLMEPGFSTRNHEGFSFFQHGLKSTERDPSYQIPNFLPSEFGFDQKPFWIENTSPHLLIPKEVLATTGIDIVICVHNALDDVKNCINSVLLCLEVSHRIIIVDDGSDAATKDFLIGVRNAYSNVVLIRHDAPVGYTKSANEGMRFADSSFVILLNSDTIVTPNWAAKLFQVAVSDPHIGIVGPMSNAASHQSLPLLRDPITNEMIVNELPANITATDMNLLCEEHGNFKQFPRVPLVNGFCYGIKREVIDAIGYFDEEAFPKGYGEEDDYSMRALDAGFIHAIATHCYVFHAKSKSFGKETRKLLAEQGGKVLRARHGAKRIERAVRTMRAQPLLKTIRSSIGMASGVKVPDLILTKLPLPPGTPEILSIPKLTLPTVSLSKYDLSRLAEIDPEVFPRELKLAQITSEELMRNHEFVKRMRRNELKPPQTVVWMLPSFTNILAGGIRTIFMVAEEFSKTWGTLNTFVICKTGGATVTCNEEEVKKHFPSLMFNLIYFDPKNEIDSLPASDIAFCTSWPTAYVLARYNACLAKFYFMQDYESLFYPAGSVQGLIDKTYQFGFYCIANTVGIADKYRQFSNEVESFIPGIDHTTYYPLAVKKEGPPWQVVFYGRPRNKRNAFALGLETLKIVKSYFGNDVRIVSVGSDWKPERYGVEGIIENLGVLDSLDKVADLYRKSHVGAVFMLTPHPSYQPLEYMASGCATVTNSNLGTSWLLKHGENSLLSSVVPSDMASSIIHLLSDHDLRQRVVKGGFDTVRKMDWSSAFKTIKSYVAGTSSDY
ncbi:glycosyltransferase [Hydrogenophaga sp.]|uniref:rhamnosyltransferase WsaF family glycosyltransferase n=1 Tax=Hydrogenophaga sp. TaxID=1904254 RepID=UPI00273117FF|nr:glycosyltransferase [Hydrogenophaga sp.]MDP2073515.1 glycosyltransferase [Hydrogenophaga sp.]MDP3109429.1 glycosyltransferase [Hydrogenophaga sp.]